MISFLYLIDKIKELARVYKTLFSTKYFCELSDAMKVYAVGTSG